MNKLRSWIVVILAVCMALACVIGPVEVGAVGARTRAELFDEYGFDYISYDYTPGGIGDKSVRTAEFAYSDAMLLADANEMSIDLVKASVAVAFTAYQKGSVDAVLEKMGFDALDNSEAYDIVSNLTIDDNDHVAYTIARKPVEYEGETYVAYCIPVKGTSGNAEWFSNFNLGEEVSVHKGFVTAANRVYDAMRKAFNEDGVDADHRIVWITGHSRGAACANIIAGWLAAEEFARRERTFAYTYACPSVSTKADESLTNIYNFNNIGDVVPMLPLTRSGWSYKRNGQTVDLDLDHVDNFKQRFQTVAKEAYVGQLTSTNYEGLLGSWLPERDDYFKFSNQLITQVVAYAFGGNTDCTFKEFLEHLCDMTAGDIAKKISACTSVANLLDMSISMDDIYAEHILCGTMYYEETKDMSEEEFLQYVQDHQSSIAELEEVSGLEISSAAVFLKVVDVCEELQAKAREIKKVVDLVTQLFVDSNGKPLPAVMQAHDHTCYITWINSMFYGYQGWKGNKNVSEVYIPAYFSEVGKGCFGDCTGLKELVVEDGVYYLGDSSFRYCTSLQKVQIPVDIGCSITSSHPFVGTSGVTEIRYTYGRTGVMTDRTATDTNSTDKYHQYTLEHASRSSLTAVSFDEGITHIGSYAFYPYYYNSPNTTYTTALTTVELPSTLQSIGDRAFSNCSKLTGVELPKGLVSIGKYAFNNCDTMTQIAFPSTLTEIPDGCFYDCDGITELEIPDTITKLGSYAFYSMKALEKVTMPVDVEWTFSYGHPFAGTDGVTEIRYTYGRAGVMTDRTATDTNSTDKYHQYTLEHASRSSLTAVSFDEGITHIGSYAFYPHYYNSPNTTYTTALTTVELPSTLQSIGARAFSNCTVLTDVELPEGMTSLGAYAFSNCDALTQIQIPSTISKLPEGCFYDCDSITELVIPDTLLVVGTQTFASMDGLRTVTMPVDLMFDFTSGHCFSGTAGVTSIRYTVGVSGRMLDRTNSDSGDYHQYTLEHVSRSSLTAVSFDEGITHIGSYAFYPHYYNSPSTTYTTALTTVELPSTLQSIGEMAFAKCSVLDTVEFDGAAPRIGMNSFNGVTAVCKYPANEPSWTADTMVDYGGTLTWQIYCNREHDYVDGLCTVCGGEKPVTDPGLTLKYPTLSFEDEIIYNVYYTVTDPYSVVEMGLMMLSSYDAEATIDDAIGLIPGYVTNGTMYLVKSEGIPAAYMGDTVYFKVYAKLTDGTYAYSGAGGYNAKAYANTVLGGSYTEAMKSLVVAMVEYGAEAQLFFGHNIDKLVNAALTDEQKALVSSYDESMVDAVVAADSSKTANFVRVNSNFSALYPSVSFDGAFSINYYCTPAIPVDAGMTLYWWDAETYDTISAFSVENATGSMEMTATNGQYWGCVPDIAAKDMDKTYYVSCVFESEGEPITSGIIAYSLGRYCEGKAAADGDAQQAFAQATAVYGYYAKRYFAGIA